MLPVYTLNGRLSAVQVFYISVVVTNACSGVKRIITFLPQAAVVNRDWSFREEPHQFTHAQRWFPPPFAQQWCYGDQRYKLRHQPGRSATNNSSARPGVVDRRADSAGRAKFSPTVGAGLPEHRRTDGSLL